MNRFDLKKLPERSRIGVDIHGGAGADLSLN
jgi:hypothetical protein